MPDPLVLGFDTSAAHCAAVLLCGDLILAERHEEMAKGQAERLMPLLEEMLAETDRGWTDLDRIGVGIGPGNFTGIRISVSAARGLALGLGIPAIGVSTFEASALDQSLPVAVIVPARRSQVYRQRFGSLAPHTPEIVAEDATCDMPVVEQLPPGPLVRSIARVAASQIEPFHRPAPLYVRSADAAPSRIAPPVILS